MTDEELRGLLNAHSDQTRRHFDVAAENMRQGFAEDLASATREIRRHFDVSTEQVRHEVRLLAEAVAHLDEKLDRTAADTRDEMQDGFGETHTLIRALDQRLRAVESHYKQ